MTDARIVGIAFVVINDCFARMSEEDRQMFAAIDAARKSLPKFFEAWKLR